MKASDYFKNLSASKDNPTKKAIPYIPKSGSEPKFAETPKNELGKIYRPRSDYYGDSRTALEMHKPRDTHAIAQKAAATRKARGHVGNEHIGAAVSHLKKQ